MNFGDLVRDPDLALSILVPGDDALDRTVTGTYITDLPDPSRFVASGDVVLTSALWASRPGGAERFIDALARQEVAGLVIGLIDIGVIPDDVIALCRDRRLTLATIAETVSFKFLTERIASGQPGSSSGILARGAEFNRRLSEVASRGAGVLGALQAFRDETSIDCWLLADTGGVLATAGPIPAPDRLGTVWNAMIVSAASGPSLVADDEGVPSTAWPVGGRPGEAAGYLVCSGDHRGFSAEISILVDALLTALRIELELSVRWRDSAGARVADLVHVLADDSASPGEISARIRLAGLDPQRATAVVAADVDDTTFPSAAVLEIATRMFATQATPAIGCVVDSTAVLLVSGSERSNESRDDAVRALAEPWLPWLAGRQLRIGVSDPVGSISQLSSAVVVARERLAALSGTEPVLLASTSQVQTYRGLLGLVGDRTRSSFAADVLQDIAAYDTKNGGDLVGTLAAFLDSNGAWVETARQLHLHPNTLRYRIGRIEALTGRDLGTMHDRVDLYLALACLDS